MNALRRSSASDAERPEPLGRVVRRAHCGRGDDAEHRAAVAYQRDVDRELAVSADELLVPSSGSTEPELVPVSAHVIGVRGLGFLGQHRDAGRERGAIRRRGCDARRGRPA